MTTEDGQSWFKLLFSKKINIDKAEEQFMASMQKILDRNWMQKREQKLSSKSKVDIVQMKKF